MRLNFFRGSSFMTFPCQNDDLSEAFYTWLMRASVVGEVMKGSGRFAPGTNFA